MKRRDLLKSCLAAPFLGLLKKKKVKYEASGDAEFSGPSVSSYTNIEWAKQEPLTLEKLHKCADELDKIDKANRVTIDYAEDITLRTDVYVDGKFIVSFNRGLTYVEANAIIDENIKEDVRFMVWY